MDRPYSIPVNTFGAILLILPPMAFLIYLMLIASKQTYIYLLLLIVFGVSFYMLQKFSKHYHWIEYMEAPKRTKKIKAGTVLATIPSTDELVDDDDQVQ